MGVFNTMKHLATLDRTSLEKLPKWAQEHITYIEMRLREATKELEQRLDSAPRSEVAIERICDMERPFAFLPERSTISFFLDNDHHKDERQRKVLRIRRAYPHRGEKVGPYHLEVSTGGGGYPSIQSQAANIIRVRVVEEF